MRSCCKISPCLKWLSTLTHHCQPVYGESGGGSSRFSSIPTLPVGSLCGWHVCDLTTWTAGTSRVPWTLEQPTARHPIHHEERGCKLPFLDVLVPRKMIDSLHLSIRKWPILRGTYPLTHTTTRRPSRVYWEAWGIMHTASVTLQANQRSYTTWRRSSKLMGFPQHLWRRPSKPPQAPPRQSSPPPPTENFQPEDSQKTLCTRYVRGLGEKLERILAPLDIHFIFTSAHTLKRTLMRVKSRLLDNKRRAAYHIPCNNCDHMYTGKQREPWRSVWQSTDRPYRRVTLTMALQSTYVAKSHHSIDCKEARVVKLVQGYWEQRTMEAIEIKTSKSSMNLHRGLHLPSVWNPVLDLTWPLIPHYYDLQHT